VRTLSLLETNPYLKDPDKYQKALIINVSSSSAIETAMSVESIVETLTASEVTRQIKKRLRSVR